MPWWYLKLAQGRTISRHNVVMMQRLPVSTSSVIFTLPGGGLVKIANLCWALDSVHGNTNFTCKNSCSTVDERNSTYLTLPTWREMILERLFSWRITNSVAHKFLNLQFWGCFGVQHHFKPLFCHGALVQHETDLPSWYVCLLLCAWEYTAQLTSFLPLQKHSW